MKKSTLILAISLSLAVFVGCSPYSNKNNSDSNKSDPLPSWNDVSAKSSIIKFVDGVINPNNTTFVPEADRIAVFDNDGTLWSDPKKARLCNPTCWISSYFG